MKFWMESRAGTVRFRVKVQARARREGIVGIHNGALRVRVSAPPLQGRANQAVVTLLAERLHVPQSFIKIATGVRAPLKVMEVAGLDGSSILDRLCPGAVLSSSVGREEE